MKPAGPLLSVDCLLLYQNMGGWGAVLLPALRVHRSRRTESLTCPLKPQRNKSGLSLALGELLAGIGEVAIIAGLTQIVAVFDARIYRTPAQRSCLRLHPGRKHRKPGRAGRAENIRRRRRLF